MTSPISRRRFLRQTGAAAAAAGISQHLARRASAAPDANSEVVVGLMGAQIRGQTLVDYFAAIPGVHIAYVCDPDASIAGKCLEKVNKLQKRPAKPLSDFREMLDDEHVDGLIVAAPDHWHALATILACQAGKHVYCEKPATHNFAEGAYVAAAIDKYQCIVQIGTQRRSSQSLREMVDFLHSGGIGSIHFARSWIASKRPSIGHAVDKPAPPENVNYDLWLGPAPPRPFNRNHFHYNWHWQWEYGTGEIGNNGVHGLDLARWGLGVGLPNRVSSSGGKYFYDDDQVTPDTQIACFEYPGKLLIWEHRTWSPHDLAGARFGVEFHGADGVVTTDGKNWSISKYDEKTKPGCDKPAPFEPAHQANWIDCIRNNKTPAADITIGHVSAALCHFANISQRVGRQLEWDAKTNQFVGDCDDANGLLRRQYRAPWTLPQIT